MKRKNSYMNVSKKKIQVDPKQTSIFDFLEADNEPFPLLATSIGCGLDILNPVVAHQLKNHDIKFYRKFGDYMENFVVPYFVLPNEPDRFYTKVLVNNCKYKLSKHYIVSNDFLVKVVDERGIVDEIKPNEKGLYRLNITDGRKFYMTSRDITLASFLGFRIWLTPMDANENPGESIKNVHSLFDISLGFFEKTHIYLLDEIAHNLTNITVQESVDPVLPTGPDAEAEPDLTQTEEEELSTEPITAQPLLPVDIYGIKDGYFYDPQKKQVVSPTHNIIVSHRLAKDGTVQLEAISSDPQVVPLVTVNLDELHAVIYEGKKLLPTSHIIVEGEPDPQLKIDMETVPLALTAEMKEMIKKAGAGDNRQLAASVYGGKVTPEHTKIVKSYKKYLQEQKDKETT